MSIVLLGNGTTTSSISLTTLTLNDNNTPGTDRLLVRQNVEILKTDAGLIWTYLKGDRYTPITMTFTMLTNAIRESIDEFIETVQGARHWFTLQTMHVYVKGVMTQPGNSATILYDLTNLDSSLWPVRPIYQWAIILAGVNGTTGERRKVSTYSSTLKAVIVGNPFSGNIAAGDTFIIGLPVVMVGDLEWRRRGNSLWEITLQFEVIGE